MKELNIITQTRKNFLALVNSLSEDQLNSIPAWGKNNIAWNFGHIIATQQVLCYVRSGLPVNTDQWIIDKYQRGTKPEAFINASEMDALKGELFKMIEVLEKDLQAETFQNFEPFTTGYGVTLNNIIETVKFVSVHESLHYGVALTLKKSIS